MNYTRKIEISIIIDSIKKEFKRTYSTESLIRLGKRLETYQNEYGKESWR